jgi:predicted RNase H-like HicB family nuclease
MHKEGELVPSQTDLIEDLSIPFVFLMYSVSRDGDWTRHVEYPELPGCVVESTNALEAIEQLEELRVRIILDMRQRGEQVPRPRKPLESGLASLGSIDLDTYLEEIFRKNEDNR